jgi:hypothetical protein
MSVGWRPPLFCTQCVQYNLVRKNYDSAAGLSIGDQAVEECVSAAFPQQLVLCHPLITFSDRHSNLPGPGRTPVWARDRDVPVRGKWWHSWLRERAAAEPAGSQQSPFLNGVQASLLSLGRPTQQSQGGYCTLSGRTADHVPCIKSCPR